MAKTENVFIDPKPEVKTQERSSATEDTYVYTGEKNYEAPKPDPWVEEQK